MTNLQCMTIIAAAAGFFVYVMSVFEKNHWPSENAVTLEAVLKELFHF